MTKPIRPLKQDVHAVVLVPSETEWEALRQSYEDLRPGMALGREFLSRSFGLRRVVFVHTGEEAVEAAVSAQYAVDRWSPRLLASNTDHDAFTHVASRNGLTLVPVENLDLAAAALANANQDRVAPEPAGLPEAGDVTTTADVTTTDDVSTTEDVTTADDVVSNDDVPPASDEETARTNQTATGQEPVRGGRASR